MKAFFNKNSKKIFFFKNLKSKLILAVVLLLILFMIVIIVSSMLLNSAILKRAHELVLNNIKQTDMSLSYIFEQAKEQAYFLSVQITEQKGAEKLFSRKNYELSEYEELTITNNYISELAKMRLTGKLDSVFAYGTVRGKLITSDNGVFNYRDITNYNWLNKAFSMKKGNALMWTGYCNMPGKIQQDPYSYIISLICKANVVNRGINADVYLGLNFNESTINKIINDVEITPNSTIYLVDEDNIIISASDKRQIGQRIDYTLNMDLEEGGRNYPEKLSLEGETYQVSAIKNNLTGWNIVAVVPEREIFAESKNFWRFSISFLIIISAFVVYLSYMMIVKYVDQPVSHLVEFMEQVEEGDFSITIHEKREDEFGILYDGLNKMVGRIDILIRELYQVKLLKRDIELKYLQKLINPHFLYNTLDTIKWLANENRLSDVSALTIALSNQYRTAFNRGQEFITLEKSLKSIEDYFLIFEIRYGDIFTYEIDVDEELKSTMILNLMLQPIVENALLHGLLKKDSNDGIIKISVKRKRDTIKVMVYDNGLGIKKDSLKLIRANLKAPRGSEDSGLKIVNHRLSLFYGPEYELKLRSTFRRGSIVSFVYPFESDN